MRATFVPAAAVAALFGAALAAPVPKPADPPPVTEKDLRASQNNLKQIGLALHNYESTNGYFPADIVDRAGKPLLSWRVAILPYTEEGESSKPFKLDEAWDSEHNKKLIEKMPTIYAPVRVRAKAGETFYQTFTGEKAVFGGKVRNPKVVTITDGLSNTGMVFEAGEPTVWTKPGDMPFDPKKELPKLGGLFDGDFHVVLCDGSVRRLKKGADEKELRKLIMPADGLAVDFKKLEK